MSNARTIHAIDEVFGPGAADACHHGKANVVVCFEALVPSTITRFEPHTAFDPAGKWSSRTT